jgi:hypothetical protein
MRTLTICAAPLLLMCVGCGRPEHDSTHRRLGGAWIADGGLTRYVFRRGIYRAPDLWTVRAFGDRSERPPGFFTWFSVYGKCQGCELLSEVTDYECA